MLDQRAMDTADLDAAREAVRALRTDPDGCWGPDGEWHGYYEFADCRLDSLAPYWRGKFPDGIPSAGEAAILERIPIIADQIDRDGRRKVVLMAVPQGSDLVQRFMAGEIVPGLHDYYGDPARGFAGGYLEPR